MIEKENTTKKVSAPRKKNTKRYAAPILAGLVIVLALTSAYFYKKSTTTVDKASRAEVASLVEKVGRLAIIPTDETPTVATVSDPAALKNQTFFIDAKKGDKVLIYSNTKKAILYDPVQDKIINIAPLNMDTEQKASLSTPVPETKE